MSAVLILMGLGISVFSAPVLKVMAGPEFWNAADAVPFLIAATIFGYFVELSAASFLARGETGWLSRNNYFTAFTVTLLYFAMIPPFGYVGAAAALALSQLLRFIVINNSARNRDVPCVHLRPLAMMMLVSVVGCAAANHVLANDNIWVDIGLKSLAYIVSAALIVGVLWADPKSREQLQSLLRRAKRRMLSADGS
jgi:O-antigen/teichoic acid export membrane protein